MTRDKKHRRITYKIRRCRDGWQPVILIGEEPLALPLEPSKAEARDAVRARAAILRKAGAN